jgi:hypothetical protein
LRGFFYALTKREGGFTLGKRSMKKPLFSQRWFYSSHNLRVPANVATVKALLKRAGRAGYNGIVLADYSLQILDRVPASYFTSIASILSTAKASGITVYPMACPIRLL